MTNNLTPYDCGDDDVIAFGDAMFRAGKLKKTIDQSFDGSVGRSIDQKLRQNGLEIPVRMIGSTRLANEHCQWFEEGINCEILDLATRRWRKGKVRVQVSVEFLLEDTGEKMLLPGERDPNADRVDTAAAGRLSPQSELSGDEFTGEYVFSSIHHNDR
jgi:KGK domain